MPSDLTAKINRLIPDQRYSVKEIAAIFEVTDQTVRKWLNTEGPLGLRGAKQGTRQEWYSTGRWIAEFKSRLWE